MVAVSFALSGLSLSVIGIISTINYMLNKPREVISPELLASYIKEK